MKQIIEFQQTPNGNYCLIETDMQHGVFNKFDSGRKRLSIVKTTDTQEELLARTRIVGGRGIELIKTTWANYDEGQGNFMAMYERTKQSMRQTFNSLKEVQDARKPKERTAPLRWKRHQEVA